MVDFQQPEYFCNGIDRINAALKSFALIKSKMDPCVYYTSNLDLIIAIYVDDILIFWKEYETLK